MTKNSFINALAAMFTLGLAGGPAAAQLDQPSAPPVEHNEASDYASLFPGAVPGTHFLLSAETFKSSLTATGLGYQPNSAGTAFLVNTPDAAHAAIVYYFNSNLGPILTEIEIRFPDEAAATSYFLSAYPPNVSGGEFSGYRETEGYRVKAWQFSNKVFFVAVLENTRWSNQ